MSGGLARASVVLFIEIPRVEKTSPKIQHLSKASWSFMSFSDDCDTTLYDNLNNLRSKAREPAFWF
jgi:hypothetical protein